MTNYEKLISYLPSIYQKTNNLKLMQSIAILFDKFDEDLKSIDKMWIVEEAAGEYLDIIGNNLQVYRELNQKDSVYKTRIKMKLYNTYFVPLLDNLIDFVENITGYYAENTKEGWLTSPDFESGKMTMDLVVPYDYTKELLVDLESVYSAGVRLDVSTYVEAFTPLEGFGIGLFGLQGLPIQINRVLFSTDDFKFTPKEEFGLALLGLTGLQIE
mgnify:CR=1 FL=1